MLYIKQFKYSIRNKISTILIVTQMSSIEDQLKTIIEEYHKKYLEHLESIKTRLDNIDNGIDKIQNLKNTTSEFDKNNSMMELYNAYDNNNNTNNNSSNIKIKENFYDKYNKKNIFKISRYS